jgi:hypothetical protein
VITPRATRLVRVANLQAFREVAVALALDGTPRAARDRLVVVPTRAAAAHLVRSIEDTLPAGGGRLLPDLITPDELVPRLATRLPNRGRVLEPAEREVLLGVACRVAAENGAPPPFHLRPGLVAEILSFYDALRWNQKDVDVFERLALGLLEPGASYDRGAERLVRQTRFLVAAFREFERRTSAAGGDEHALRDALLQIPASRPYRHVVLTVTDRTRDPYGLAPAHWDLLARVPGLERLDLLVTDRVLAGSLHERLHALLPGIEEVRVADGDEARKPQLLVPAAGSVLYTARDREEEVAAFARQVKQLLREGSLTSLDRVALVVHQPLPYVYTAREVLRSGGLPSQLFDALPLAAEPYAAALDLVFSCVATQFARGAATALLRSPHFRFTTERGDRLGGPDIASLDRLLAESGYLGDPDALERLVSRSETDADLVRLAPAVRAARALQGVVRALRPLMTPAPIAAHLAVLEQFLSAYEALPAEDDPQRSRHLRARGAILATVGALRAAYQRFDERPAAFDVVAALLRRWIEAQTFAPRSGESGVHLVDAASAAFGCFEHVHLAGLVDGEWPNRPRRNVFYSSAVLRELGWPSELERLDGARAAFADLLRLPSTRIAASTFLLESDALVSASPLVDEIDRAQLEAVGAPVSGARVFEYEALRDGAIDAVPRAVRAWVEFRAANPGDADRYRGATSSHRPRAFSLSALERYQDCPFKYFASDVLRLEALAEDEDGVSPRARGRFVHEVFHRFFQRWDEQGGGAIGPERVDAARALFAEVADPLLAQLPAADASLERARLFGSAISVAMVDIVLGLEAVRPEEVRERWLEHRLEGEFSLGDQVRRTPLRGVADRIDLLEGRRIRVIDYKTGSAPNPRRALQVPVYAMCVQERLDERDGGGWIVDEAAYVAFSGRRTVIPVVKPGATDAEETLQAARARLFDAVDGIGRGEFPPRPHDPAICRSCAYAAVCRKDYVTGE